MLSDNDLMNVQQASRTMSRPVTILVNSVGTNDPFEKNLLNVARQIAGVSSEFVRIEDGRETVSSGQAFNHSLVPAWRQHQLRGRARGPGALTFS